MALNADHESEGGLMADPKGAEDFAKSVVQAVEDDHLLSREALPLFIASELEADRNAVRLALLTELLCSRGTWESRIWALQEKYSKGGA